MPQPDDERLIAEAARWFAHMRGPDAEASREQFNAWIADNPQNLAAYNEIAELFSAGKSLKRSRPPGPRDRGDRFLPALIATGTAAVTLGLVMLPGDLRRSADTGQGLIETRNSNDEISAAGLRGIGLPDGSLVTLDTGSRLRIAFTPKQRTLTLLAGRIRFDVAHDRRPFVVVAAASRIVAHGTLFDVSLNAQGQATVNLLQGSVDVDAGHGPRFGPSRRLAAGEQVRIDPHADMTPPAPSPPQANRWLRGEIDYDDVALSSVLAAANRQSPVPIELGEPDLGRIRVSGTLSLENAEQLVRALTGSLDLDAASGKKGEIILRRHE